MALLRVVDGGDTAPDDDEAFVAHIVEALASISGMEAIHLGGSRGNGRAHPSSDWDLGVYFRGPIDHSAIEAVAKAQGWDGEVFPAGAWGPVMNGGAWLRIDGRKVDLLWRDLDAIDRLLDEAEQGQFEVFRIPFYLTGIPSYVPLAELSAGTVLWGDLPFTAMPPLLRRTAARWWADTARLELAYAEKEAQRGSVVTCLGMLVRVLLDVAHATLATEGRWPTNEKRMIEDADLAHYADALGHGGTSAEELRELVAVVGRATERLSTSGPSTTKG